MTDINTAKRLMASVSLEAAQILGAGVSRPCHAGRYNAAASAVLSDPTLDLAPDQRELIASHIEGESEPGAREYMLRVRMSRDEWDELKARAYAAGLSMSEYVRVRAVEDAVATVPVAQEGRE